MSFGLSDNGSMANVFETIAMLMALVLAWRGYRSLAREDRARKVEKKIEATKQDDRRKRS
jgi:hypothetical protein